MQGPNHVIRTTEFPIQPGEDAQTNPGVFGRTFADYLAAQIRNRGVGIERVIPEDFGYCIMLKRKPLRLWIACSNRAGRTDEWIAFAVAEGGSSGGLLEMYILPRRLPLSRRCSARS